MNHSLKENVKIPQKIAHQLTKNVKFFQKVAIICNDKVLILKRDDNDISRPGAWDLPGGNSEWPVELSVSTSNLHEADAVREVQEETQIELSTTDFTIDALVYFNTFFDVGTQVFSSFCGWCVPLEIQPNVTLSNEHTDLAWITLEEVENYNFGSPKGEYIKEIIRNGFSRISQ